MVCDRMTLLMLLPASCDLAARPSTATLLSAEDARCANISGLAGAERFERPVRHSRAEACASPETVGLWERDDPGVLEVVESAGHTLHADARIYARVAAELPELAGTADTRTSTLAHGGHVRLDLETYRAVWEQQDTDFECALIGLGVRSLNISPACAAIYSVAPGTSPVLAAERLAQTPGVVGAWSDDWPDLLMGRTAWVNLGIEGDRFHYVFRHGSGDCPSGCTSFTCRHVVTSPGAAPVELGTWNAWSEDFCSTDFEPARYGDVRPERLRVESRGGTADLRYAELGREDGEPAPDGIMHGYLYGLSEPFHRCYVTAVLAGEAAAGDVTLEFEIEPRRVESVRVAENRTGRREIESCLLDRAAGPIESWPMRGRIRWTWRFWQADSDSEGLPGELVVAVEPAGGEIVLDGVAAGKVGDGRWSRTIASGTHRLHLTDEAGIEKRLTVDVPPAGRAYACWSFAQGAPCAR